MHFVACTTEKYFPNKELVERCRTYAAESVGSITLTENVEEGTRNADVIYTDVWVSMGEPDEAVSYTHLDVYKRQYRCRTDEPF